MSKTKVKMPKKVGSYIKNWQAQHVRRGERKVQLKKYAATANGYHRKSKKMCRRALGYARDAGQALCNARALHRKRGTWQPWVKENFNGSCEKARVYMRLARRWDDPEIKEARLRGDITSLATFLSFTAKAKAQALLPNGPEAAVPTEFDLIRQDLLQSLKTRLRLVSNIELLREMQDNFPQLWADMFSAAKEYLLPEWEWSLLHPDYEDEPEPDRSDEMEREHERWRRRMVKRILKANAAS